MEVSEKSDVPAALPERIGHARLFRMVAGFSKIFWGIPIGVLLFTGTLRIEQLSSLQIPSYVVGALLIFWGATDLYSVIPMDPAWDRRARRVVAPAFLLIYFTPFLFWWTHSPDSYFYVLNVYGLGLSCAWLLILLNLMTRDLARVAGDAFFEMEARFCAAIVWLTALAPVLAAIGVTVRLYTQGAESGFPGLSIPEWMYPFLYVPFALTMANLWKGRRKCLELLDSDPPLPLASLD